MKTSTYDDKPSSIECLGSGRHREFVYLGSGTYLCQNELLYLQIDLYALHC
jgi:hypothetical protein